MLFILFLNSKVAGGRRDKLTVFGGDYPGTVDGTGVRDYIHVISDFHIAFHFKALNILVLAGRSWISRKGTWLHSSIWDVGPTLRLRVMIAVLQQLRRLPATTSSILVRAAVSQFYRWSPPWNRYVLLSVLYYILSFTDLHISGLWPQNTVCDWPSPSGYVA